MSRNRIIRAKGNKLLVDRKAIKDLKKQKNHLEINYHNQIDELTDSQVIVFLCKLSEELRQTNKWPTRFEQ